MSDVQKGSDGMLIRFILKHSWREIMLWSLIFSLLIIANAYGFVTAYPTEQTRTAVMSQLSGNVGIQALLGKAYDLGSVGSFTAWRGLGQIVVIGSIWAIFFATRLFRGEEEAGRLELILSGNTTRKKAAISIFIALTCILFILFASMTTATLLVGLHSQIDFTIASSIFFGLTATAPIALCMLIGAVASQFATSRHKALVYAGATYGLFYIIRIIADTSTSLGWLRWLSPLGWIEELRAFTGSHVPPFILLGFLLTFGSALVIKLSDKRDIGSALLSREAAMKPRAKLLHTDWQFAIRSSLGPTLLWCAGIAIPAFLFGMVSQTGSSLLANANGSVATAIERGATSNSSVAFLGAVFLFIGLLILFAAANYVAAIREQEAQGYLDNILVRGESRFGWLVSKTTVSFMGVLCICSSAGCAAFLGAHAQHGSVTFSEAMLASVNFCAPAVFVLGLGVLVFGLKPQLTGLVVRAIVGWSLIIQLVGSIVRANHWIMDTSLLTHVAPVPALSFKADSAVGLVSIGIVLGALGCIGFVCRDLRVE